MGSPFKLKDVLSSIGSPDIFSNSNNILYNIGSRILLIV